MKTIREAWESFVEMVIPSNAPEVQITEMRRAFYAGVHHTLCSIQALSDDSVGDDEVCAVMDGLVAEVEQFNLDVQEGRA